MSGLRDSVFAVVVLILIMCVPAGSTAQGTWQTIQGKVIDSQTRQPLPFTSIRVHHKNNGTLSNEDGNFVFKIPAGQTVDSIEISFVGYRSSFLPTTAFSEFKIISLEPATKVLDAVTIRARSGLDMIKEFIDRIPENYDTIGKKMQAFYREEINLGKDSLTYNEAVLDVYKSSYTNPLEKDQLNLLKGRRKKLDWKSDPLYGWMSGLSNGPRGSLMEDIVKAYRSPNSPLNPANFKYYSYTVENTIDQGSKSLYVIAFAPLKKVPRSKTTLDGYMFINASSMALERIEWKLAEGGLRYQNNHRGLGYTIGAVAYQASVRYRIMREVLTWSELGGKWHLKEVQRDFWADVTSRKRNMIDTKWNAKSLFVITDVAEGKAMPMNEADNIMNKTISVGTLMWGKENDKVFWENYNIVQPAVVDTLSVKTSPPSAAVKKNPGSNRQNGFTRADSLHGNLTPLRTCYDVLFYHLSVRVDPAEKFIEGSSRIRFKVVSPFRKLQVDLYENMTIEKILWHGNVLTYTREFGAVYVEFPSEQKKDTTEEITVFYSGHPQGPNFSIPMNGGFLWSKDKNGKPWVQVVCQGSGSSVWWPSKDHLSDEPDSARISITVPSGLTDISNGRLLSKTALPGGLTKFDWYVHYPINSYNITLNIGDYTHRQDSYAGLSAPLTIDYYYTLDSEQKAQLIFKKVKPMLALFESRFGPYPFPRDGFTLMESLYPMEHQSAVSIGKFSPERTDSLEMEEIVRLMHHEVSHEWWGNNVSIGDFADFWVHEAFATYAEALALEARFGKEASDAYLNSAHINNTEPIIGVYGVNHIFYDLNDIYNKGALVINTLRHVIHNDTLWFTILRGIQEEFKYKTISTRDIESYISRKAGTDLAYFFEQYLRKIRPPRFIYTVTQQGTATVLKYKWEAEATNFRMPLEVTVSKDRWGLIYPGAAWKTLTLKNFLSEDFEIRESDFYIEIPAE